VAGDDLIGQPIRNSTSESLTQFSLGLVAKILLEGGPGTESARCLYFKFRRFSSTSPLELGQGAFNAAFKLPVWCPFINSSRMQAKRAILSIIT
jgi:hypothetical protein